MENNNGFDPNTGLVTISDPMYFVVNCVGCKETTPTNDSRKAESEFAKFPSGQGYRLVCANPYDYPNDLTEKAIRMGGK